jgi:hypothetical protein
VALNSATRAPCSGKGANAPDSVSLVSRLTLCVLQIAKVEPLLGRSLGSSGQDMIVNTSGTGTESKAADVTSALKHFQIGFWSVQAATLEPVADANWAEFRTEHEVYARRPRKNYTNNEGRMSR